MATAAAPPLVARPTRPASATAPRAVRRRGIGAWLTTTDHKKIGLMYIVSTFAFFLLAGVAALLVRLQLALPESPPFQDETYNQVFTTHATVMLFLFIIPFGVGGLGNYLVPLMIGATNFLVTILNMRTPGTTMHRLPLFVWAILTTSFIQLLATPPLAAVLLMTLADRHL